MPDTTTETPVIDRAELAERLVRTANYPSKRAALAAVDDVTRAIGDCLAAGRRVRFKPSKALLNGGEL